MSRSHLLALDLGTTRVCALLVDPEGRVCARAQRPLGARIPAPDRFEQDPGEMWERSVEVLRESLATAGVPAAEVAALGVVTQRSTALAWRHGEDVCLAPALGWPDRRSAARAAELRAAGVPVSALPSATKFEWLLRNEPAVGEAARDGSLCLGTPDVWLTQQLTSEAVFVTDPGHASCTALYDLASGGWSAPALEIFGVPAVALPEVVASNAVVGETPAALLGAAVPVAARAGDQQAACFAQGVHGEGAAKLTLGTSAMLDVHAGGAPPRAAQGSYPLALWRLAGSGDAFCREGTVISAGAAVDWLAELGLLGDVAELDEVASGVESSEGALFVPALQGLGTPYLDDLARAQLGGLTRGTRRAHVVRAVLEGIAQRCVDLCDALALPDRPLAVDGGLARSALLLQTLADLAGRPLQRAAEIETTALGAAQLAGLGVGALPDLAACRARLAAPRVFSPRLDPAERTRRRARWKRKVEALLQPEPPAARSRA